MFTAKRNTALKYSSTNEHIQNADYTRSFFLKIFAEITTPIS